VGFFGGAGGGWMRCMRRSKARSLAADITLPPRGAHVYCPTFGASPLGQVPSRSLGRFSSHSKIILLV
jgi:hypothetical protein